MVLMYTVDLPVTQLSVDERLLLQAIRHANQITQTTAICN